MAHRALIFRRILPTAAVAAVAAVAPGPAWANVFEVFGAGAKAQGVAGMGVTTGRDPSAAWLNPATLVDVQRSLTLGWFSGFDRASILLMERPAGYDPETYDTRVRVRRDTDERASHGGLVAGLVLALPARDLALGAVLYAPTTGFARLTPHFTDEREQFFANRLHFDVLGERLRGEVIAAGLGWRGADWLSLGVGMAILPINRTDALVYTPNAGDPASSWIAPDIEVGMARALIAGAVVEPTPWLRLGVSFQDEIAFTVRGSNEVQLGGTERGDEYPFVQHMHVIGNYSPPRVTGGATLRWGNVTGGLEARWRLWRRYRDSFNEAVDLEDTVDLTAGIELRSDADTVFRAGAALQPTPVPDATGRRNLVDNQRVVLALGGGRRLEVWGQIYELDLGLQAHGLLERTVRKTMPEGGFPACEPGTDSVCDEDPDAQGAQIGNPGFPGWTSGGYLLSASLDLRWLF